MAHQTTKGAGPTGKLASLSGHLWEAANILRGPVDAVDFKTYIFPLLFFKRISDVYDEEYRQALDASEGDQQYALFPENHRFQIHSPRGGTLVHGPTSAHGGRAPCNGRWATSPAGRHGVHAGSAPVRVAPVGLRPA
jgi:hypothetical protein